MKNEPDSRQVVVCLHGSPGNSHMWRAFVDAVSDRCEVLTPSIDFLAGRDVRRAAEQVLLQVGRSAERFHVVGHAYGGAIALQLASRAPDRVASLVLYEPAVPGDIELNRLDVPVRLLCGTRTWPAARLVIDRLRAELANSSLLQLVGLRHMAPLTHPDRINPVILDHILPEAIPEAVRMATEGQS